MTSLHQNAAERPLPRTAAVVALPEPSPAWQGSWYREYEVGWCEDGVSRPHPVNPDGLQSRKSGLHGAHVFMRIAEGQQHEVGKTVEMSIHLAAVGAAVDDAVNNA